MGVPLVFLQTRQDCLYPAAQLLECLWSRCPFGADALAPCWLCQSCSHSQLPGSSSALLWEAVSSLRSLHRASWAVATSLRGSVGSPYNRQLKGAIDLELKQMPLVGQMPEGCWDYTQCCVCLAPSQRLKPCELDSCLPHTGSVAVWTSHSQLLWNLLTAVLHIPPSLLSKIGALSKIGTSLAVGTKVWIAKPPFLTDINTFLSIIPKMPLGEPVENRIAEMWQLPIKSNRERLTWRVNWNAQQFSSSSAKVCFTMSATQQD